MSKGKVGVEQNVTDKGTAKQRVQEQTQSFQSRPHLQNVLFTMQRKVGNQATTKWVHSMLNSTAQNASQLQQDSRQSAAQTPISNAPIQKYQYIDSDPPTTKDSQIYGIYQNAKGTLTGPIYVGQTTLDRAGSRFIEHVKNDGDQPWHMSKDLKKGYDSNNETDWPFVPRELEELKDVTKFEVTAAEQYWWEHHGGRGLYNKQQPLKNNTFHKYKTIGGNYDPKNIGLGNSWEPTDM